MTGNKKFKELKNYEPSPPHGFFAAIWKKIVSSGSGSSLPEAEHPGIHHEPGYASIFSQLQSYTDPEHTPPAFEYPPTGKIKDTDSQSRKKVLSISRVGISIAAAAIIGIAAWFFISNSGSHNKHLPQQQLVSDNNKRNNGQSESVNKNDKNNNAELPIEHVSMQLLAKNRTVATNLEDNDFIFTYTNFTVTESQRFLADIKRNALVFINEFSYVNISGKMSAFLEKLYEVNKNDKPTKLAKKMKKKLKKWKQKDERHFDKGCKYNALDIIDLSDFIFKN